MNGWVRNRLKITFTRPGDSFRLRPFHRTPELQWGHRTDVKYDTGSPLPSTGSVRVDPEVSSVGFRSPEQLVTTNCDYNISRYYKIFTVPFFTLMKPLH